MLRSSFFAFGLFVTLWGASFLMIDKVQLRLKEEQTQQQPQAGFRGLLSRVTTVTQERNKVFEPPQWLAFTLLSVGAVTMLYAVTLPKRSRKD